MTGNASIPAIGPFCFLIRAISRVTQGNRLILPVWDGAQRMEYNSCY
jgi:hypothetical protein